MGEWSDWPDPSGPPAMPDVDVAGGGGDPYAYDPSTMDSGGYDPGGAADIDYGYDTPDTSPTGGSLPGANLVQFGAGMINAGRTFLGRPGGYAVYQDDQGNPPPNLGVSPMPPGSPGNPGGQGAGARAGALVRYVRQSTGLRVSGRAIVGLIVKYGFQAAAALTKLGLQDLLFLFMREKGVRHHRRGPGLYTVARKLRAAQRLQGTVARILGRGRGGYRRHRRHPFHAMHKRRKARR